ncbi:CHAP domain-containing protein [Streptococcus plurextorum]|uniref:CHAP domain-containing protein n=1 Tax=Streptococcus plurextorum TaxID=456876 RepID=UPI00040DF436|nr:CHAP domain-containing protein [Streptococcus plurextorum]
MKKRKILIPTLAIAASFVMSHQASARDYGYIDPLYGSDIQGKNTLSTLTTTYTSYDGIAYGNHFTETDSEVTSTTEDTAIYSNVVVTPDTSNTYPVGQCTWGVKELATWVGNYWGNAANWDDKALSLGFSVGTTPQVGAVIVWDDGLYGHVAYVTDVDENGNIQVQEANYGGSAYMADSRGIGNYRGWFNPLATSNGATISYIYPPATV